MGRDKQALKLFYKACNAGEIRGCFNAGTIELHKDNVDKLKYMKVGQSKIFDINLQGRTYEHKEKGMMYFTSLVCWKFNNVEDSPQVEDTDVPTDDEDAPF